MIDVLAQLFASGSIIDIILVMMVAEGVLLGAYGVATGRGIPVRSLLVNLAAGAALMLALRSALTDAPWMVTAGWLGAGLLAHLLDLAVRWR